MAIVSLDAKKAFDSVNHNYMYSCLRKYGFSESFINIVKLLYTGIQANVMINGFKSSLFDIEQSVKQGDSLSCDLFVICIDPLIRSLNIDTNIANPITGENGESLDNTAGYADDVAVVTIDSELAVQTIYDIIVYISSANYFYNLNDTKNCATSQN